MKIAISGFGNSSYAFIATLGKELYVYSRESEKKNVRIKTINSEPLLSTHGEAIISGDPEFVFKNCDLVIVTNTGNSYKDIIKLIRKYTDCEIIVTPGQNGLSKFSDKKVFALSPLPFNCRIKDKFESVEITYRKENFYIFGERDETFFRKIKKILYWVKNLEYNGFVYMSDFVPLNSVLHTTRIVNLFRGKDYLLNDEYFYEDMKIDDTNYMVRVSEEIGKILISMGEKKIMNYDIEYFLPKFVYRTEYNLLDLFNKHFVYKGFKLPVVMIDGKFYPDKNSRYFFEDIDNLLCLQEKAKEHFVETPEIDNLIIEMKEIYGKSR